MRIVCILTGLGCSLISLGCSGDAETDESNNKEEGRQFSENASGENLVLESSYTEKIQFSEGCQQYIYKGDNAGDYKSFQRTGCYVFADREAPDADFEVTVYYQRHALSTWNVASFNKKHITNPAELTDAHLSQAGISQAIVANKLVATGVNNGDDKDKQILSKGSYQGEKVVFATSNLRRSALTFLITFKHLLKNIKKLHILSALQETTGNMDSNPLSRPQEIPKLSFDSRSSSRGGSPTCPLKEDEMRKLMETRCNQGNEQVSPIPGSDQLLDKPAKKDPAKLTTNLCTWMYNVAIYGEDFMDSSLKRTPSSIPPPGINFVFTGHGQYILALFKQYKHNIQVGSMPNFNVVERNLSNANYRLKNSSIIRFKVRVSKPQYGSLGLCKLVPASTQIVTGEVVELPWYRRGVNKIRRKV